MIGFDEPDRRSVLNGEYDQAERQTLRTVDIGLRSYKDPVSREAVGWIRKRLRSRQPRPPPAVGN